LYLWPTVNILECLILWHQPQHTVLTAIHSISIYLFSVYPFQGTTEECGNSLNVITPCICEITAFKFENIIIIYWLPNKILILTVKPNNQLYIWFIRIQIFLSRVKWVCKKNTWI
jgi:hypothetical protein